MNESTRVCQIALSVVDLQKSLTFYQQLFSLAGAGGTDQFRGEMASKTQGLPDVASQVAWLVDDRDFFQLELFQFENTIPKHYAKQRFPEDIGYSRIAFDVENVDAIIEKVESLGGVIVSPVQSHHGNRYFFCKDPNAILIQVVEAEMPTGVSARLSGIAASVPSLDIARQDFDATLGFRGLDGSTTMGCHLWDNSTTEKKSLLLDAETIWIELNEYSRPGSRPWPKGYQLCDYGILSIAVGYREEEPLLDIYKRSVAGGFRANSEPMLTPGAGGCIYVYDQQGFSVEMLALHPDYDSMYGFKPV